MAIFWPPQFGHTVESMGWYQEDPLLLNGEQIHIFLSFNIERPLYYIVAVFGFVFCVGAAITKERWREWGSRSWQEVRHLRYVLQPGTQYTTW